MKKLRILFASMIVVLGLTAVPAFAYGPDYQTVEIGVPLTVHVDGSYVSTDVQPYIKSGRTFLPMRAAAESMDASVSYDASKRCVTVSKDGRYSYFFIGNRTYYVDGQARTAAVAPEIKAGRTMLPIRDFSEAFGAEVNWDQQNASVKIYTGKEIVNDPNLSTNVPENYRWLVEKYYVVPNGNGVGTWMISGDSEQEMEILFISKMKDGTKNVVTMHFYRYMGHWELMCVGSGELYESPNKYSVLKYQQMLYSQAPGDCHIGNVFDHFDVEGNNLRLTGRTTDFGYDAQYENFNIVAVAL